MEIDVRIDLVNRVYHVQVGLTSTPGTPLTPLESDTFLKFGEPLVQIGDVPDTKGDSGSREAVVLERQVERVTVEERDLLHALLGDLLTANVEHAVGEVDADDFTTGPDATSKFERKVCGTAAAVEHAGTLAYLRSVGRKLAPADVEPGGHHAVHHVVGPRNAVEHGLHALGRQRASLRAVGDGVAVRGRREVVGAHALPQRGSNALSMPQRSSTRPATKSTMSSTDSGCV